MDRSSDFYKIERSIFNKLKYKSKNILLANGDSLNLIKSMPDKSVSLILTDPPYHSTKKKNIYNDTAFEDDVEYLAWMDQYIVEWRRILKPNGSIFVFCASDMAARLEINFLKYFNVLSQIVWTKPNEPGFDGWKQKMKKEALRQWYAHSERIIFAEPACEGNLNRSYFANFLKEKRTQANLTAHKLTEITKSYGKVNHGGAVSNWETGRNVPSRDQYDKICNAIIKTRKVKHMPPYEDVIRPFQVDATKEFTDIWTFPSVKPYKDKHPAEKPISMLKHAIEATTFPGDVVLDCFAGAGTTSIAAFLTNRKSVSIEIEESWVKLIKSKFYSIENNKHIDFSNNKASVSNHQQPQLFAANN